MPWDIVVLVIEHSKIKDHSHQVDQIVGRIDERRVGLEHEQR